MIEIIHNLLMEMSLLSKVREPPFYVSFNRNFNFFIFDDKGDFYQVKVSSERPLRNEYQALKMAYNAIPANVPEPLGFYQREGLEILICRGIKYKIVKSVKNDGQVVGKGIKDILKSSKNLFREENPIWSHMKQLTVVCEYFKNRPFAIRMGEWLEDLNPKEINSLPHIKQHGDFTFCNMGVDGDRLIIFDWEDFGKVTLPGFDICCLVLNSITEFSINNVELISETRKYPKEIMDIIDYSCQEFSINKEIFFNLFLIYFLHFLYLKDKYGYSQEIIKVAEKLLVAVLEKPVKC